MKNNADDRIYRIGQKHDVTVHVPLAIHPAYREYSFDCVLNNLMKRKRTLARAALWPPTDSDFDLGALIAGLNATEPADLSEIDGYNWKQFEDWVIRSARDSGDWKVSETPASGDGGADAVLRHRHRRNASALVQVKHTENHDRPMDKTAVSEIVCAQARYQLSHPAACRHYQCTRLQRQRQKAGVGK